MNEILDLLLTELREMKVALSKLYQAAIDKMDWKVFDSLKADMGAVDDLIKEAQGIDPTVKRDDFVPEVTLKRSVARSEKGASVVVDAIAADRLTVKYVNDESELPKPPSAPSPPSPPAVHPAPTSPNPKAPTQAASSKGASKGVSPVKDEAASTKENVTLAVSSAPKALLPILEKTLFGRQSTSSIEARREAIVDEVLVRGHMPLIGIEDWPATKGFDAWKDTFRSDSKDWITDGITMLRRDSTSALPAMMTRDSFDKHGRTVKAQDIEAVATQARQRATQPATLSGICPLVAYGGAPHGVVVLASEQGAVVANPARLALIRRLTGFDRLLINPNEKTVAAIKDGQIVAVMIGYAPPAIGTPRRVLFWTQEDIGKLIKGLCKIEVGAQDTLSIASPPKAPKPAPVQPAPGIVGVVHPGPAAMEEIDFFKDVSTDPPNSPLGTFFASASSGQWTLKALEAALWESFLGESGVLTGMIEAKRENLVSQAGDPEGYFRQQATIRELKALRDELGTLKRAIFTEKTAKAALRDVTKGANVAIAQAADSEAPHPAKGTAKAALPDVAKGANIAVAQAADSEAPTPAKKAAKTPKTSKVKAPKAANPSKAPKPKPFAQPKKPADAPTTRAALDALKRAELDKLHEGVWGVSPRTGTKIKGLRLKIAKELGLTRQPAPEHCRFVKRASVGLTLAQHKALSAGGEAKSVIIREALAERLDDFEIQGADCPVPRQRR